MVLNSEKLPEEANDFNHVAICSGLAATRNKLYRSHRPHGRKHSYIFSRTGCSNCSCYFNIKISKYGRPSVATAGLLVLVADVRTTNTTQNLIVAHPHMQILVLVLHVCVPLTFCLVSLISCFLRA